MKKAFFNIMIIFAVASTSILSSCNQASSSKKSDDTETSSEQGKEYTSKYICPMHCEGSGSDTEGKCPVCGMDYVLNEKQSKDDHNHDHDGHDHNHD